MGIAASDDPSVALGDILNCSAIFSCSDEFKSVIASYRDIGNVAATAVVVGKGEFTLVCPAPTPTPISIIGVRKGVDCVYVARAG